MQSPARILLVLGCALGILGAGSATAGAQAAFSTSPSSGPAGTTVQIKGEYRCSEINEVHWKGRTFSADGKVAEGPALIVPGGAPADEYVISFNCTVGDNETTEFPSRMTATAAFTVTAPEPVAELEVAPGSTHPGGVVKAMGTGYPSECRPALQIADRPVEATEQAGEAGSPVLTFTVPEDVEPGVVLVRLSCGRAAATTRLTILPPVTVDLVPGEGQVDAEITARGLGYVLPCRPALQVAGEPVRFTQLPSGRGYALAVGFRIPDRPAGTVPVRLSCGDTSATTTLAILPPPEPPLLGLESTTGPVGTDVVARGSNFPPNCRPALRVDGTTVRFAVRPTSENGRPAVDFRIPDNLRTGTVSVRLSCGNAFADAKFEVRPAPAATLTLNPGRGRPATDVTVRGANYPRGCDPAVRIAGRSVPLTTREDSAPQRPVGTFTVPRDVQPGSTTVRLTCGATSAEAPFNVLPPSTGRPTPSPSSVPAPTPSTSDPTSISTNDPTSDPTNNPTNDPTSAIAQPPPTTSPSIPIPIPNSSPSAFNPVRPDFPRELPTPDEVSWTAGSVLASLATIAALWFIIGYPAEQFNKTIEENRHRLPAWLFRDAISESVPGNGRWHFLGYIVGSAILLSFVEAGAGFDIPTLVLAAAFLLSVPFTTLVYSGTAELYLRRADPGPSVIQVVPVTIVIAALCVVLSKVAGFQPGYAYGLFAVFATSATAAARRQSRQGPSVLVGAVALLVTGVVAWLVWPPINAAAEQPDAGPLALLMDSVLATTFVLALQGVVFGLAPIEFMDGKKLWSWKKPVWVATWAAAAFLFVHVLFQKYVREWDPLLVVAALAPFLLFGMLSIGLWIYLRATAPAASGP